VFEAEPRYLAPVGGMVIGNSMSAAAVALNGLADEVRGRAPLIEAMLALGATSRRAASGLVTCSLRSGMIPLMDPTETTRIVFFPGTMVGMLVAAAEPVDAVRLQPILLWALLGSVALSALNSVSLRHRSFFTSAQLAAGVGAWRRVRTPHENCPLAWKARPARGLGPGPHIEQPTDAIVRITSTCICGSDLHLYEVLGPYFDAGDILGHEPMGVVEEVGSEVEQISPADRVVSRFNVSCGHCETCERKLYPQCETTQVRDWHKGAALLGYTKLYGQVAGGHAELLRVPKAFFGPVKVPEGPPDERFVFLSDVLPTAWQAVEYATVPEGGSVSMFGLGPIGQMCCRVARRRGAGLVIGVDLVPERLEMARRHGADTIDRREVDDVAEAIREKTDGRGVDSVIDAVGMKPTCAARQAGPGGGRAAARRRRAGDVRAGRRRPPQRALRLHPLGQARRHRLHQRFIWRSQDPLPMMQLFDKQLQLRMGQANVCAWVDDLMPLLTEDGDPLGTEDPATHKLPFDDAPHAYEIFQRKEDQAHQDDPAP
jgi:threonine dehydrogenase-like Zn-dependent dehydrogenase